MQNVCQNKLNSHTLHDYIQHKLTLKFHFVHREKKPTKQQTEQTNKISNAIH